jgi:RHS repeat-associated protein
MCIGYYPFGMLVPNRTASSLVYRYGFQGQDKDDETGMEAFELRLWDGRLGRWLTVHPKQEFFSPYVGMGNNPISLIDPDGGRSGDPETGDPEKDLLFSNTIDVQVLPEVFLTGGSGKYNLGNSWTTELDFQYSYVGTQEQWIAQYGQEAFDNYSNAYVAVWKMNFDFVLTLNSQQNFYNTCKQF